MVIYVYTLLNISKACENEYICLIVTFLFHCAVYYSGCFTLSKKAKGYVETINFEILVILLCVMPGHMTKQVNGSFEFRDSFVILMILLCVIQIGSHDQRGGEGCTEGAKEAEEDACTDARTRHDQVRTDW